MSEHTPVGTVSDDADRPVTGSVDRARAATRSATRGRRKVGRGVSADGAPRPRIKKLRFLALLTGIGVLAAVSTFFGMMMAVASDLPALEEPPVRNSTITDREGRSLGLLTGSENRILLSEGQIAPAMKHAIISIEDQRFYTNEGVDLKGIARAAVTDALEGGAVQGASTITQQFVKNATAAQDQRTVLNKLREAALAFHLTRRWSKERILRNYLNTIYFGNGAYGIESAARTYFGSNHPGCEEDRERPCAAQLTPPEAALLAAVVASPSGFDPVQHPAAARARRNTVLLRMSQQGYIPAGSLEREQGAALPAADDVRPPEEKTDYPYFTSWVKSQAVAELGGGQAGARRAFEGGLQVRTTLDSQMQDAAQSAVDRWLPRPDGPSAAVVLLDNRTAEVRAMVSGDNDRYDESPFNLSTQGQRQPGSAFKPFVMAEAIQGGISPTSTWSSSKQTIKVPGSQERFEVNNYEDEYQGPISLSRALAVSDNAVFAQVGVKVGTNRIAGLAQRMGIRTPVSHNLAMTLGGLREGVTPIDMAHAYLTLARGGRLVYGSMSQGASTDEGDSGTPGVPGIREITRRGEHDPVRLADGSPARNRTRTRTVLPADVARQTAAAMAGVVTSGTGTKASLGPGIFVAGKTGTTENYGDAWFVGWTERYTMAVWVGYPDGFRPMENEWQGKPVSGGTYPAAIWHDVMQSVLALDRGEKGADAVGSGGAAQATPPADSAGGSDPAPTPVPELPPTTSAPEATDDGTGTAGGGTTGDGTTQEGTGGGTGGGGTGGGGTGGGGTGTGQGTGDAPADGGAGRGSTEAPPTTGGGDGAAGGAGGTGGDGAAGGDGTTVAPPPAPGTGGAVTPPG